MKEQPEQSDNETNKTMAHIFDTAKLNSKQASIAMDLISTKHMKEYKCYPVSIFSYGDRYFFGTYENWVLKFVQNNPTGGDFYVWLQQQESEVIFH